MSYKGNLTLRRLPLLFVGMAAISVFSGLACDNKNSGKTLSPGTLRLISITTIAAPERRNLINNGDFGIWWAGAPACEGFSPPNAALSSVTRGWGGEKYPAKQTWNGADTYGEIADQFHVSVENIQPGSWYQLVVTTEGKVMGPITLSIWQREKDTFRAVHNASIELMPVGLEGMVKTYATEFRSGDSDNILIAAVMDSRTTDVAEVTWKEWGLYPITVPTL